MQLTSNLDIVTLKSKTPEGSSLSASFYPAKGMNLVSYRKGDIEIIDQSTKDLFEERFAGLGAMIGPHFHHRPLEMIPKIKNESLFPHIGKIRAKGVQEPFSHGIGRYAPWKYTYTETKIQAQLLGSDLWNGLSLAELEGQNFKMEYIAELTHQGLYITLSVVSDRASVVGLHTYYYLPGGSGKIIAKVRNQYNDQGEIKKIPLEWNYADDHTLTYLLIENTDYGFYPYPDPLEGQILLKTSEYHLKVSYQCVGQENSWQLWHPKGKSFVCIEPLSAQDPRNPHLTASNLNVLISIL